ncbi:probable methyltransferase TARBP1 isoform X1 [Procambarus clarkii]|uniref:probable methyltransferase TARBP1 isoform X1 n=1 Tax=Procambarus clarkii TaxID=6728 RepID=UPI003742B49B
MAAELLSLGLLDDHEYHSLLKKLLNCTEFSIRICEVLINAVDVREAVRKSSVISEDGALHNLYQELLQQCLLPQLERITEKYSILAVSSKHYQLPHISETENSKSDLVTNDLILKDDNLNAQECNDAIQKALKADELILASKLSWLIIVLLKIISSSCKSQLPIDIYSKNIELCNNLYSVNKNVLIPFKNVFENIAKTFDVHYLDTMAEEERHKVKILSLIFANLLKDSWCMQQTVLKQAIKRVVEVTLKMIEVSHDADTTALLLTLIIQPYMDVNNEDKVEVVLKLWNIICNFYYTDKDFIMQEKNATGFLILCFIAGHMFEGDKLYHIGNESALWKIIQYGLTHTNPLSRKRCQYILKRYVDHCSSFPVKELKSEYMCWPEREKKDLAKIWNDFFLLVETLEEKQAHVVKPILERLDNLINICCRTEKMFHVSWTLVIFKRIFDQDNKNIKQWGVMKFLQLKFPEEVLMKGVLSFIALHLLSALSDYCLYSRDVGQQSRTVSAVGDQIVIFFVNVIESLGAEAKREFMCVLIEQIFDGRSWGGIPLFYLIRSLALMPKTSAWNFKVVKSAVANFEGCLSTQEVVLRSASQCDLLKAIFKHLTPMANFLELCDIVGHFRRKESWCRGTVLWKTIVNDLNTFQETWQTRFSLVHCAIEKSLSASETISPHDIALGINLLLENISQFENVSEKRPHITSLLSPIIAFLKDCHLRPYLDQKKFMWALELIIETLEILCDVPSDCQAMPDELGKHLCCLTEGIDSVAQLFVLEIRRYNQPYDFEVIAHFLNLFAQCSNLKSLKCIPSVQYPVLLDSSHELLNQENVIKVAFGTLLLEHLVTYYYESASSIDKNRIVDLVNFKIVCYIENEARRRQIDGYYATEHASKLLMETTRSRWSCVDLLIKKNISLKTGSSAVWNELQNTTREMLLSAAGCAGRINVLHVFHVAVSLASSLILNGIWQELVDLMWLSSLEFRKGCDLYRSLVGCVTDLLFHDEAVVQPDNHGFITQMCQQMMAAGEGVQGIAAHMSRSLVTTLARAHIRNNLDPKSCNLVQDVLVPLLMFGSVFRKQFKIVRDTTEFIQECGQSYSTNSLIGSDHDADLRARSIAMRFLLTLKKVSLGDRAWALAVAEGIRYQYARCTGDRRDFANSQKHRYKTRLLQAFLLILPLLDKNACSKDLEWLCRGLIKDHQQPSVRYLQEWGVALITIMHPQLFPDLLSHFLQGTKERVGCVGSFLAALTHVACTSEDDELLCQAIQYTLPWCMAQHFNTRLYAQVSLRKIWHHCEAKGVTRVLEKYEPIQQCLQFVVEQGSAARNTLNMLNDFYFKVFHPLKHLTLETILHDLPCLSLLADDEWVTVEFFLGVRDTNELPVCSDLPLYNPDKVLAASLPAPWVVKAAGETSPVDEKDGDIESVTNVQRKITPWKSMVAEISASLDLPQQIEAQQRRGSLIIVASLIDKPPNLGGLCRTCEVFSVKEYVVPSLSILEDQAFNSLSLTSQQWVPMREVKPEGLAEYLRTLQSEGYTLVAAEQTANSIKLSEYSFPERTVVVLGNEREGIPCELLQLLEVCVEIPQSGIIRSLNVHVSGALFIWEYTRQHLKKLLQ